MFHKSFNFRVLKTAIKITQQSIVTQPTLDQLNDDCLLTIFERLDLNSLGNVAFSDNRFKALATSIFIRKYQHLIDEEWKILDRNAVFIKGDLYRSIFAFCAVAKSVKVYGDGCAFLSHCPNSEKCVIKFNTDDNYRYNEVQMGNLIRWCPNVREFCLDGNVQSILMKSLPMPFDLLSLCILDAQSQYCAEASNDKRIIKLQLYKPDPRKTDCRSALRRNCSGHQNWKADCNRIVRQPARRKFNSVKRSFVTPTTTFTFGHLRAMFFDCCSLKGLGGRTTFPINSTKTNYITNHNY